MIITWINFRLVYPWELINNAVVVPKKNEKGGKQQIWKEENNQKLDRRCDVRKGNGVQFSLSMRVNSRILSEKLHSISYLHTSEFPKLPKRPFSGHPTSPIRISSSIPPTPPPISPTSAHNRGWFHWDLGGSEVQMNGQKFHIFDSVPA